jgi:hypothetical protein
MKAAHLQNEINPFASAFCAPYAWSSRKGHGLRSLLPPARDEHRPGPFGKVSDNCVMGCAVRIQVQKQQTDRFVCRAALKCIAPTEFLESLI